jgi:hypothetical protein
MILEGKILVDTMRGRDRPASYGLSVIQLGGYMFGQPARITAVTYLGKGRRDQHRARNRAERPDPFQGAC